MRPQPGLQPLQGCNCCARGLSMALALRGSSTTPRTGTEVSGGPAEHGLIHSHRGFRFVLGPHSLPGHGHTHGHRCSQRFLLCHGLIPSLGLSSSHGGSSTGHSSFHSSSHCSSCSTETAATPWPPASPAVSPGLSSKCPQAQHRERRSTSASSKTKMEPPKSPTAGTGA